MTNFKRKLGESEVNKANTEEEFIIIFLILQRNENCPIN